MEKETDESRKADVKCSYALTLIGIPRGSKTESGYSIADTGRLRDSPSGSAKKCKLLFTDPLVRNAKGVINCSALNTKLSKLEFNTKFIGSIARNKDNYTCEIIFKEETSPDDMKEFLR